MTEFCYGDEVTHLKGKFVRGVVVDERRWGGSSAGGGVGDSPEFQAACATGQPVYVVADAAQGWYDGAELKLRSES